MKIWKLVSGILSIALSLLVLLQSCAAGISNSLQGNGEVGGSAGLIVSILLLVGGIVSIVAKNGGKGLNVAIALILGFASILGFSMAGSYADLKIWAGWCFICAILSVISIFRQSEEEDVYTPSMDVPQMQINTPQSEDKKYIEPVNHAKTANNFQVENAEISHNFQKDNAGLYPYEILMLSYLEKYAAGKEPARFWEREYGVDDVPDLIKSLEQRGFAKNGKLTEAGKSEIAKNEYVLYMHKHKYYNIPLSRMSILVNKNPNTNYRDLLWEEFNRLSVEYMQHSQFGLYRNTRFAMYQFLVEEKRYVEALPRLAEAFFYDLNGSDSPYIAPALIEGIRELERKIDYTDEKMRDELQKLFAEIYVPYQNYTNNEVIYIIIAYCFGHDEMAEEILQRHAR